MNEILLDKKRFELFKADKRVKKNLFIYYEERFNRSLKTLENSNKITNEIYKEIYSTGSQPARLYGLPKVHKSKSDPNYRPNSLNAQCI